MKKDRKNKFKLNNILKKKIKILITVSRLMGSSAGGSMGHAMTNMGSLAACNVSDTKPMQFPLAQRRKRRVLFTQAQVCFIYFL